MPTFIIVIDLKITAFLVLIKISLIIGSLFCCSSMFVCISLIFAVESLTDVVLLFLNHSNRMTCIKFSNIKNLIIFIVIFKKVTKTYSKSKPHNHQIMFFRDQSKLT